MSVSGLVNPLSFPAAADLTSHQYKILRLTAAGTVNLANAGNQDAVGVLQNNPQSGKMAAVSNVGDETKVIAGAAIGSCGILLASDANGLAVTATSGEFVIGRALTTASGSGAVIRMVQAPFVPNAALA